MTFSIQEYISGTGWRALPGNADEWTAETAESARELRDHAVGFGFDARRLRIVGDDGRPIAGEPDWAHADNAQLDY